MVVKIKKQDQLNACVEALYRVFGRYPLRAKIDGCPHCELDETESRLHGAPLRELSWTDLETFSWKAMTTFGDVDDYRHFLPRILELLVVDYDNEPWGVFIIFSKLTYGNWMTWPEEERAAVKDFLHAWLRVLEDSVREEVIIALEDYKILSTGKP